MLIELGGIAVTLWTSSRAAGGFPGAPEGVPPHKWHKLRYNLDAAREQGHDTLVTFGGAYSNHIRATAAAGRRFGFRTVGLIRGEEHTALNPSLRFAADQGMELSYLDRSAYRRKDMPADMGRHYLIPEGGSNEHAVRGCAEWAATLGDSFDLVAVPVGTGGTIAGLAAGLKHGRVVGFSALKGGLFLNDTVADLQRRTYGELRGEWSIETDFHFGGYARTTAALLDFVTEFEAKYGVCLDPTYTGKMLFGLRSLASQGVYRAGTRACALITG